MATCSEQDRSPSAISDSIIRARHDSHPLQSRAPGYTKTRTRSDHQGPTLVPPLPPLPLAPSPARVAFASHKKSDLPSRSRIAVVSIARQSIGTISHLRYAHPPPRQLMVRNHQDQVQAPHHRPRWPRAYERPTKSKQAAAPRHRPSRTSRSTQLRTQIRTVRAKTAAGSGSHNGVRSYLSCGSSSAHGGYNSPRTREITM